TFRLVRRGLQRGFDSGTVLSVPEVGEVAIEEREALLLLLWADLGRVELAGDIGALDVAWEDRASGDEHGEREGVRLTRRGSRDDPSPLTDAQDTDALGVHFGPGAEQSHAGEGVGGEIVE